MNGGSESLMRQQSLAERVPPGSVVPNRLPAVPATHSAFLTSSAIPQSQTWYIQAVQS
jgi:hypothetical protein